MVFRNARSNEQAAILALYRSAIGDPFCTWNEFYPGMEEIEADFRLGCLYVLAEGEHILGALSVAPENEMENLPCWRTRDNAQEIARVVVAKEARGQDLALRMVDAIAGRLRSTGCASIHLAVAKVNLPAQKVYARAGFVSVGEAELYGHSYFLMERQL